MRTQTQRSKGQQWCIWFFTVSNTTECTRRMRTKEKEAGPAECSASLTRSTVSVEWVVLKPECTVSVGWVVLKPEWFGVHQVIL